MGQQETLQDQGVQTLQKITICGQRMSNVNFKDRDFAQIKL